jgi:hypothetical protein
MREDPQVDPVSISTQMAVTGGLHRVEHYALYLLNGMAAAGSGRLTDEDIDLAIDMAERLAGRLTERGHIKIRA